MLEKIKQYANALMGVAVLVFGALLFSQRKRNEKLESELANALASDRVKELEKEREKAHEKTTSARDEFNRAMDDYRKG